MPPGTSGIKGYLSGREIDGLRAALIVLNLEVDLLTFGQGAHSSLLNGRHVNEHVLAAIVRRNETETTGGVEELYGTSRHLYFSNRRNSHGHHVCVTKSASLRFPEGRIAASFIAEFGALESRERMSLARRWARTDPMASNLLFLLVESRITGEN
jgi:hypothetical protein